jgi:putative PIN family toxin of toxin-antitoxin system
VRIVLDTHVVMSAPLWRGPPYRLLETIRERSHLQLYSSAILLEELTDVLSRPAAGKRLALIGKASHEVLASYLEVIELAEPTETPRIVRDPDDDHVIATALAARASLIVSGDRDLLDLGTFRDIRILNAADALRMLSA